MHITLTSCLAPNMNHLGSSISSSSNHSWLIASLQQHLKEGTLRINIQSPTAHPCCCCSLWPMPTLPRLHCPSSYLAEGSNVRSRDNRSTATSPAGPNMRNRCGALEVWRCEGVEVWGQRESEGSIRKGQHSEAMPNRDGHVMESSSWQEEAPGGDQSQAQEPYCK